MLAFGFVLGDEQLYLNSVLLLAQSVRVLLTRTQSLKQVERYHLTE
jgi:hypothetical protein